MTAWQTELEGKAWNSLFLGNHDQPRCLSRFGDDSPEYRVVSAKMLATCLHMMQGTPYVYQGDELGMKNVPFHDLSEFRDIESINAFHELTGAGKVAPDDMMRYLNLRGRDNARTPMQWSTEKNAGFSEAEPWIAVNDNYKTINAEASVKDPKSVFPYYKKLVQLRHEVSVITDGVYKLLDADNEKVYTYLRKNEDETLLVICNFTKETIVYPVGDFVEASQGTLFISNYDDAPQQYADAIELKPYGAYVYEIK